MAIADRRARTARERAQTHKRLAGALALATLAWGAAWILSGSTDDQAEIATSPPGDKAWTAPFTELVSALRGQQGLGPWAEDRDARSGEDDLDEEPAAPGLGELRAHRPGEREATERPLHLVHHRVQVKTVGNVARTEIEETFRNDGPHTLEGVYRFPLPPDARIAHLSLEVDGNWEDGAFVERAHARRIWRGVIRQATPEVARIPSEEFVWVPGPWRDPALLEWQQGGRFELRIFPIPAHGERRVRIAYTQTLPAHGDGRRYVYPLARSADESTRVGRFEVEVQVAGDAEVVPRGYAMATQAEPGKRTLRFAADDFHPAGDLVIEVRAAEPGPRTLRWWTFHGQATAPPPERSREGDPAVLEAHRAAHADARPYVMFALRPDLPPATALAPSRDHMIVVDASQSMVGERYGRAVRLASAMVEQMDPQDRHVLLACDATCRAMHEVPASPSRRAAADMRAWLLSQEPAGASDLRVAMEEGTRRSQGGARLTHVVYIGDGAASAGPVRAASLAAEVRALVEGRTGVTVSTVGIGGDPDVGVLTAIARSGGGHHHPFVPGRGAASTARAVLEADTGSTLRDAVVELPEGIEDVVPRELPTVRAGEEVLVMGRMTRPTVEGEVRLHGSVAGRPWSHRLPVTLTSSAAGGNAFVPAQWAAATIEGLELEGRGDDVPRVVALSKAHGVLSRHTSLLVLESEAMFRAFGVDRARPAAQWTGEEAVEYGATDGFVDLAVGQAVASNAAEGASHRGAGGPASRAAAPAEMDDMGRRERARDRAPDMAFEAMPASMPPRPGQWMRRVWVREGRMDAVAQPSPADMRALRRAEDSLREQPDSRDRHRDLVRALSRVGELDRAVDVARRWLERDPMDAEALTYLADALGRQGRRDEALRLLSGVVDVSPGEHRLQTRLVQAFDRAAMPERACAHRVASAELDPRDASKVAEAVRCERALGRAAAAARLLAFVPDARVASAAARLADAQAQPRPLRGELLLDATWDAPVDLDLTLVTPQGTRLSWMGGRTHVVGEDAQHRGRERLGLRHATPGSYLVEVARTSADDTRPVQGRIQVRVLGQRQTVPFTLVGDRLALGRIEVSRRATLVPAAR
jgi:hypothetical protein